MQLFSIMWMYFRFNLDAVYISFTTNMVGWVGGWLGGRVVGKLESNDKLNSKLKLKLRMVLSFTKQKHYFDGMKVQNFYFPAED